MNVFGRLRELFCMYDGLTLQNIIYNRKQKRFLKMNHIRIQGIKLRSEIMYGDFGREIILFSISLR